VTDNTGDYLETEQKYDADADFVLPDLSGLDGYAKVTRPQRYYLSATYFDTEEFDLNKNRITLRRRVGGADEGWHLKLPVRKDTRQELRAPLGEGSTGTVPARLAEQVEDVTAGRPLHPIAILDTERTVVRLTSPAGEALAEVADDRVTATQLDEPAREPMTWREIEVEAVARNSGALGLLEAAGRALREAGARRSSFGSKLARLLGGLARAQRLLIAGSDLAVTQSAWNDRTESDLLNDAHWTHRS
jgi:inorganic triphosphatase YgiF